MEPASVPSQQPEPAPQAGPAPPTSLPIALRTEPPPLRGGLLTFLRFARRNHMLRPGYALLLARWAWLRLRWRGRLVTDGVCFVCPRVELRIGKQAKLHLGRWSWIGHDTKISVHEGEVRIGAKTVLGQECRIYAYQHVSIGRECLIADRTMLIDFDHGASEVERPIREQGIYKRDVRIGHNVWAGHGTCFLRGVTVGDNAIIGAISVVTRDVPANAVVGGAPARLLRMRPRPRTLRWG